MSSVLLIEYNHPKKKNIYICGKFQVKPGINEIRKEIWFGSESLGYLAAKDNPGVKALLADEYLKVLCEKGESKQSDGAKKEDEAYILGGYSVSKSKLFIKKCIDVDTLVKWRKEEKKSKDRKGVIVAIEDQLEAIDKESKSGEKKDD